jgi:predicted acetyltransferase
MTTLELALPTDSRILSNLLELYIHDLSGVFPHVELGPDGRFGYPKLPLYWTEPEQRFAFLIRERGAVAGFALVTRGSPAVEEPNTLDVAEFFVLRRYRRTGVGRAAVRLLWRRLPGMWTVRVSEANPSALLFWSAVIGEQTAGKAVEFVRPGQPSPWHVYWFEAPA